MDLMFDAAKINICFKFKKKKRIRGFIDFRLVNLTIKRKPGSLFDSYEKFLIQVVIFLSRK
jgi:hypothetical protein